MCGIAGIVDFQNGLNTISKELLTKMSDIITHRGPDSDGQWVSKDNTCGLSFRRLAIIDLTENGSQPMHSPDGRHHIVFNGEIYTHQKTREELLAKGYQYHSETDTETILYGYREFGSDVLDKFVGMWAIAIWDEEKQELFASRDRIGVKPFYYYYKDGIFIFGSEIKSILQHPKVSRELNIDEIPNYLNYGMSSKYETLFKNIKKLPSGHKLILNKNGLKIERYWSPFNSSPLEQNLSDTDIQSEVMRLLRQSVKDRMMSDVPFGVFLSGGIDSSVNVALMAELMNRPVDTFTVGFKELEEFNELEHARKIAKQFATNHNEVLIDHNDAFDILHKLPWYTDEPNADPVCIPLYFLSKLTRDSGTIVVQVGEGSDEQFVGYRWMLQYYHFYKEYWAKYKSVPNALKLPIYHILKPLFKFVNQNLALDYIRRATYNDEFNWSGVSIFSPSHQEQLLGAKYRALNMIPAQYGNRLHQEADSLYPNADYLQKILFVELQQRLAEILLMRVDKIGMAHSIEARVPFLDHRLVEFSMSLPESRKVWDKSSTKMILKKAVEHLLPNDIIYRKKQGFAAPIDNWMRNYWYEFTKDKFLNSNFAKLNILDKSYIMNMLERHQSGAINQGDKLYLLLNLHLWYDNWF
jgi:asparagine synthase (glutamine-hydrolysing)